MRENRKLMVKEVLAVALAIVSWSFFSFNALWNTVASLFDNLTV